MPYFNSKVLPQEPSEQPVLQGTVSIGCLEIFTHAQRGGFPSSFCVIVLHYGAIGRDFWAITFFVDASRLVNCDVKTNIEIIYDKCKIP